MTEKAKARGDQTASLRATQPRISADVTTDIDLDQYLDPADRLMLAALRQGNYVLAVVCSVCGKPLTARASRARGVGPTCRRRAGERR